MKNTKVRDIGKEQTSTKSLSYTQVTAKELKKIRDTDKFPCYGCFDKPIQRLSCKVCQSRGYVTGDNPMVRFVDDYLTQNLANQLKTINQSKDTYANQSQQNSHSSDQDKNLFLDKKSLVKRTQCRSALQSYQIRQSDPVNVRCVVKQQKTVGTSFLQMSTSTQKENFIHQDFSCDGCEMDPIQGPRFHCLQCQQYDLCQKCYLKMRHPHKMQEISGKESKNLQLSTYLDNLRQSTKGKKNID